MVEGELVRVLTTSSVPEGEIARARLEDEGIPVLVKGEGVGPYRMGAIHLFVPADFEIQARLILDATMASEDEDAPGGSAPFEDESALDEDPGRS